MSIRSCFGIALAMCIELGCSEPATSGANPVTASPPAVGGSPARAVQAGSVSSPVLPPMAAGRPAAPPSVAAVGGMPASAGAVAGHTGAAGMARAAAAGGGGGAAGSAGMTTPGVAGMTAVAGTSSPAGGAGAAAPSGAAGSTGPGGRDPNGPCKDLQLFCFDPFDMFIFNEECFTCNQGAGCMDCVDFQAI